MGRIKPKLIKRVTLELIRDNKDQLKMDFDENKVVIDSIIDFPSKKLRNSVAGYVTRMMKRQED